MTAKKTHSEKAEATEETVDAPEETTEETTDEVVEEVTEVVATDNSVHEQALFTGNLGGHVLLDSTTAPAGGALMGSVLGTPAQGVPGASQFAALERKQVG